jgi:hypothetical protein
MSKVLQREEIPPGTLEMLILRTLARGRKMHGFEIADYSGDFIRHFTG